MLTQDKNDKTTAAIKLQCVVVQYLYLDYYTSTTAVRSSTCVSRYRFASMRLNIINLNKNNCSLALFISTSGVNKTDHGVKTLLLLLLLFLTRSISIWMCSVRPSQWRCSSDATEHKLLYSGFVNTLYDKPVVN